jgi:predicted DNA-binding transcriptional regulator
MAGDLSVYNHKHCKYCCDVIRLSQWILYNKTCFACLENIKDVEKEDIKKEIESLKKDIKWDD